MPFPGEIQKDSILEGPFWPERVRTVGLRQMGTKFVIEVTNASTQPELYLIQDPGQKLEPDEEVEIVRYIVKDWKVSAARAI